MSVDRQEGSIWFLCDSCSETIDTEESAFQEAVATMRGAGWDARRIGEPGDWVHVCPYCKMTEPR